MARGKERLEGIRFMRYVKGFGRYGDYILTFAVMAANVFVMGLAFDFYYDLNDDTMMHDIMAGIYSGIPDGHNMQTFYPLGALIALCYRACREIPWYGLFLFLCQFGCFYLIGVRLCRLASDSGLRWKCTLLLILVLFQWVVCLPHLLNIQYTITCAILSSAAIFLFMTTKEDGGPLQFFMSNIPSILLVIVAYQLRSEMLLLTFPFICLAGLYRMTGEKDIFARENLCKYGAVLGIMLCGMLLSTVVDYAAYSSEDWKDFRNFFDARTTVYDFYRELITEDSYSGTLMELGVKPEQQILLRNYNFGLDDGIDTELLTRIADYASGTLGASKDWGAIARKQIYRYLYRLFRGGDEPYNVIVLCAYGAVFAAGFCGGQGIKVQGRRDRVHRYAFLWQLMLLAVVRTAIWMFILMRERDPERITHSLYLVEFALLAALLVRQFLSGIKRKNIMYSVAVFLCLILSVYTFKGLARAREEQPLREQVSADWQAIDDYCRQHKENFYFEDVYSTVTFSQKLFGGRDSSYANYDILGGWMCKSPLYYEKLARYHIDSAKEALVERDDVYMIMSDLEEILRGTDWIVDYYAMEDIAVKVELADRIEGHDSYSVYRIVKE